MIQRKFFTLENREEFLGVIRPSLWALVPWGMMYVTLIAVPVTLWSAFWRMGWLGIVVGGGAVVWGVLGIRDLPRRYLENGVYFTNQRIFDVYANRRRVCVTELSWSAVQRLSVERRAFWSWIGYGSLWIRGNNSVAFSLAIWPLWKPQQVTDFLHKVHSSYDDSFPQSPTTHDTHGCRNE